MKARLVLPLVLAIAGASIFITSIRIADSGSRSPSAHAALPTTPTSYLGVYEANSPHAYNLVAGFASAVGRKPNLAGYFGGWAEPFMSSFAQTARSHGAATLVQIDPTDASVAGIAAGDYDDYLRSFASAVRSFGHAVVIGFGHEMNATWYPWGWGHVRPVTFVAAWRHIVTLFRSEGADNVTWLWTIQTDGPGTGPIRYWWPGAEYVTWVGIDGYYYRPSDTFLSVFGHTIDDVRSLTSKPVLLSETAVGPQAGQVGKIQDLFRGMAAYKTLGLVWFDIAQDDGIYYQNWRIEGDQAAERAFRLGVREDLTRVSR